MTETAVCKWCKGTGTEADYVGLEMRCVEAECSRCKGTGKEPTVPEAPRMDLNRIPEDLQIEYMAGLLDKSHVYRIKRKLIERVARAEATIAATIDFLEALDTYYGEEYGVEPDRAQEKLMTLRALLHARATGKES